MRSLIIRFVPLAGAFLLVTALVAGSPEVDKLLATPRQHPYLFFTKADVPRTFFIN